jgi:hypothetical protein
VPKKIFSITPWLQVDYFKDEKKSFGNRIFKFEIFEINFFLLSLSNGLLGLFWFQHHNQFYYHQKLYRSIKMTLYKAVTTTTTAAVKL